MKKFLTLIFTVLLGCNLSFAANWQDMGNGLYIDMSGINTKGNYLYMNTKLTNTNAIYQYIKDPEARKAVRNMHISYCVSKFVVDCKNPRFKNQMTSIYNRKGKIIQRYEDNQWHSADRDSWAAMCAIRQMAARARN